MSISVCLDHHRHSGLNPGYCTRHHYFNEIAPISVIDLGFDACGPSRMQQGPKWSPSPEIWEFSQAEPDKLNPKKPDVQEPTWAEAVAEKLCHHDVNMPGLRSLVIFMVPRRNREANSRSISPTVLGNDSLRGERIERALCMRNKLTSHLFHSVYAPSCLRPVNNQYQKVVCYDFDSIRDMIINSGLF
jgi:hypothetical protein